MDIALVIFHAEASRGGAERYTSDIAGALSARGHRVRLLASSFGAAPEGVEPVLLPARALTRVGRYEAFLDSLERHLTVSAYDIVHAMLPVRCCDLYHPHAGLAAEALLTGHLKHRSGLGRASSRLANALNVKRRRFAAVERRLLTSGEPPVVLCLSEYIKGAVRRHYPLPESKLATLFNAVNLERFNPAARPQAGRELRRRLKVREGRAVALMIAQDFARKGLAEAVEALARLGPEGRPLLLVVGKESCGRYEALARRLGVAEDVVFAGTTADPYAFYSAADFFVLPTRHDPCSLVVLEALAMGLPVISTRQNGATEIMTSGQEGVILEDSGDAQALAEAMRRVLDASVRSAMREAAIRLRPRLSESQHVSRLLEIYGQVLTAKRGGRQATTTRPAGFG